MPPGATPSPYHQFGTRLIFIEPAVERLAPRAVELIGIEPTTSGLQSPRSPS
jgi:hypothetical protein